MKREDVSKIFEGATDEQINAILNINSADIGKAKGNYDTLKTDLQTSKDTIANLTGELDKLKEAGASAEDWKKKYDDFKAEITEKENVAKAEREKAEREANIKARYNAVCVDKDGKPLEFSHEAIKASYLQKFSEAISDEANTGKSDADIFCALTKDDGAAFKIAQPVTLPGANSLGGIDDTAVRAVMGLK